MKQTIILGNIITMDEKRPFAKAALVKNGVFAYIGDEEEVKELAGKDAQVLDYGDNYIYPGFIEAHAHGVFAGYRAIGQANLAQVGLKADYAKYREIIKEFIVRNPQRQIYMAAGWIPNDEPVTKAYLDEICPDKPFIMNSADAHSCLLNTKALEWAGIDGAYAKKIGYDMVHVDANGEPDVLTGNGKGTTGDTDSEGDLRGFVVHEHHISSLDSGIGTQTSHGNADIGSRQHWCIVDAIAHKSQG